MSNEAIRKIHGTYVPTPHTFSDAGLAVAPKEIAECQKRNYHVWLVARPDRFGKGTYLISHLKHPTSFSQCFLFQKSSVLNADLIEKYPRTQEEWWDEAHR